MYKEIMSAYSGKAGECCCGCVRRQSFWDRLSSVMSCFIFAGFEDTS